ncbi:aldo/keto reductase [Xylariomycetidae sp. FL0641]|nr:aldo/keto reductase [Xylariomycetidae sp. FL0641]
MVSKPVKLRQLGKDGPMVPALGFGLMGMSHQVYGALPSDEEKFALLDRALELGATFWDTSDHYGDGEALLGRWFRRTGKREHIFLASKFGYVKGSSSLEVDSSAAYCKAACAASLKALGTDSIDLYYAHNINPETPIEETMRALAELQAEGKIKHIGLCGATSATLRRAVAVAPVAAVQAEYSCFTRDLEGPASTDLLATCRALGVGVVASSPLGRGLLTATFGAGAPLSSGGTDVRPRLPRFQAENAAHNAAAVARLRELADGRRGGGDCTVAQLALAWLLRQGDDVVAIPGTKKIRYLEENWAALGIQLSDAEEREVRALAEQAQVAGGIAPPRFMGYLYRDTKEEAEAAAV